MTNGAQHLRSLRDAIELRGGRRAARLAAAQPGHRRVLGGERGGPAREAFGLVTCVRPDVTAPVIITDAEVAADYVASLAALYADLAPRPWPDIVADVRRAVQRVIDEQGAFRISGDPAAFVCRP